MTHVVRYGESMNSIARKYGTTVEHLIRLNPQVRNPNLIFAGERVQVR